MEKNTKILLGVGAVIAAYLILKPKEAIAQTGLVSLKKLPTSNDGSVIIDNNDDYIPKSPYMPQVRESTPEEEKRYYDTLALIMKRKREEEQKYCVCAKSPCNCGDGGVKLNVLIPTQSSEY
jgi:hypothetical protein